MKRYQAVWISGNQADQVVTFFLPDEVTTDEVWRAAKDVMEYEHGHRRVSSWVRATCDVDMPTGSGRGRA